MVHKLVMGPECFNGLVTGSVIIHPGAWSQVKITATWSQMRITAMREEALDVFWSYQLSPLAVSSPLWSTTKGKRFCAPFSLDWWLLWTQTCIERQVLASLAMQAFSSCVTFCPSSPFFFFL